MNRRDFLKLLGIGATTVYFDMGRSLWRQPELTIASSPIEDLWFKNYPYNAAIETLRAHGAFTKIDWGMTVREPLNYRRPH